MKSIGFVVSDSEEKALRRCVQRGGIGLEIVGGETGGGGADEEGGGEHGPEAKLHPRLRGEESERSGVEFGTELRVEGVQS